MENSLKSVVSKMIEQANGGDVAAARLVLERVMPARRSRPVEFEFPAETDPITAITSVIASVAAGTLAPDEGASVVSMLEAKRRLIETVELETRIAAVEKALSERGK